MPRRTVRGEAKQDRPRATVTLRLCLECCAESVIEMKQETIDNGREKAMPREGHGEGRRRVRVTITLGRPAEKSTGR